MLYRWTSNALDFELPASSRRTKPPEARGLARDQVRLLVSHLEDDRVEHRRFTDLPDVLATGRPGRRQRLGDARRGADRPIAQDGSAIRLHVSTRLPADLWVVEPRRIDGRRRTRRSSLPGGANVRLLVPYTGFAAAVGRPIRRGRDRSCWRDTDGRSPIRTCAASGRSRCTRPCMRRPPGSAEMPSAGRAFSPNVLERLAHTVSSSSR